MTTRHAGYVVTLGENVREDDAQAIITALSMVSGVKSVKPVKGDINTHIAYERARVDIQQRLWEAFRNDKP